MNNEMTIWTYLYDKIDNFYGTAALMGNLFAESSLNPLNATGNKGGLTNEQYTTAADSGKNDNFVTDKVAYGLAQWRYHTRKRGLLDLARAQHKSVGNIYVQLEYLWTELQSYKTVLNALCSATNIRTASDVVLLKYEKPANTTEKIKEKRAAFGQKYFNKYALVSIQLNKTKALELITELEKQI